VSTFWHDVSAVGSRLGAPPLPSFELGWSAVATTGFGMKTGASVTRHGRVGGLYRLHGTAPPAFAFFAQTTSDAALFDDLPALAKGGVVSLGPAVWGQAVPGGVMLSSDESFLSEAEPFAAAELASPAKLALPYVAIAVSRIFDDPTGGTRATLLLGPDVAWMLADVSTIHASLLYGPSEAGATARITARTGSVLARLEQSLESAPSAADRALVPEGAVSGVSIDVPAATISVLTDLLTVRFGGAGRPKAPAASAANAVVPVLAQWTGRLSIAILPSTEGPLDALVKADFSHGDIAAALIAALLSSIGLAGDPLETATPGGLEVHRIPSEFFGLPPSAYACVKDSCALSAAPTNEEVDDGLDATLLTGDGAPLSDALSIAHAESFLDVSPAAIYYLSGEARSLLGPLRHASLHSLTALAGASQGTLQVALVLAFARK
jgi:hypothetical protein